MKVFSLKSLAIATALVSSAASAVTIPLPAGPLTLEDDNLEYVIDTTIGGVDAVTGITGTPKSTGTIEVGDVLYAFITFDKVLSQDNSFEFDFGAGKELTGVSAIEVVSKAGGSFVFGPNADFEAIYGAGAMAALYADAPGDFGVDCHLGGIATCHAESTSGDLWMVAGFADGDDFWASVGAGSDSITAVKTASAATAAATANYALSILVNNTGTTFREQATSPFSPVFADGFTDIIGSGTVLGGSGLSDPFFARSDFDFSLDRIPEPGSLALLGAGLLLAGASRRRKAK